MRGEQNFPTLMPKVVVCVEVKLKHYCQVQFVLRRKAIVTSRPTSDDQALLKPALYSILLVFSSGLFLVQ